MSKVIIQAAPPNGKFKELVWRKVMVRKSLDEICHYMELELPFSERDKIHKHDIVEVRFTDPALNDGAGITSRRLTTVLVDEVAVSVDSSAQTVMVIARSPARDIIDSSWSFSFYSSPTLEQVASFIAQKFGITVIRMPTDSPETPNVESFICENESPWAKLLAQADAKGYILTSNEAGNLYLWKVGRDAGREGFHLTEGANIKSIKSTETGAEQYHEYIVKGNSGEASEIDVTCNNNRILTVVLTDFWVPPEDLKRRAKTEMLRRREKRLTVTISGWGLNSGEIKKLGNTNRKEIFWNPNFLTAVSIKSLGIDDTLLVSQVEYTADTTAIECTLTLVNKEAYA